MTGAEFVRLAEQHLAGAERVLIPVYRRLSADLLTPVSAFLALRESGSFPFLLESVEGGENLARYSFLGRDPYRIVRSRGTDVDIVDRSGSAATGAQKTQRIEGSIYSVLHELLEGVTEVHVHGLPPLTCGAVGFLGYDTVRLLEQLPRHPRPAEGLDLPESLWCFYDSLVAFDHVKHQLVLMAGTFVDRQTDLPAAYREAVDRLDRMASRLSEPGFESPRRIHLKGAELQSNVTREAFEHSVERAKRYIFEGDIFQVVLSQRFEMTFEGDRFNLYRALRQVNPSPYLYFLDFEDFALVGSSPEVLVRVRDRKAELLPIAGTRPRGDTHEHDVELEAELLADPKEQAEHVMLVDLGRNDLSRVCDFTSVKVDRLAFVERYSHVMHIVSSVSGHLADGKGPMDVLAACFPAGTVSGAPKVRAMEIIDELEPARRGIYAGAVGYADFSGNMDTCIAIRTMVVVDDRVYVQAGAGIVADSDPAREYEETVNKAYALKEAMLVASEGLL